MPKYVTKNKKGQGFIGCLRFFTWMSFFFSWCWVCKRADLDNLGEAGIFPFFVLDELQSLSLLAAQLRRLLLKLVSSCAFKLEAKSTTVRTWNRRITQCWQHLLSICVFVAKICLRRPHSYLKSSGILQSSWWWIAFKREKPPQYHSFPHNLCCILDRQK